MKSGAGPRSPLLVVAIQLGLLLFFIYYTFIGGQTAQGIYDDRWRLITLWVTTLLIGSWLLWRFLGSYKVPRTPFDLPLLFLLISWILATLFSVNSIYSREALVFFVWYLFFFYLAADFGRWPWFSELVLNAVIGVSGLVWVLALWQLSKWYQDVAFMPILLRPGYSPLAMLPRLSVLGNPNTMASYVALVIPMVIYKITMIRKPITRILLGLWLILLPTVLLLTQSRGGMLALIAGVGFYVVVWIWHRIRANKTKETSPSLKSEKSFDKRAWLPVLAITGVGIFFIGFIFRLRNLSEGVDVRYQVMSGAVKTLLQHPVLGSGPGTLGEELIRHQQPLDIIWADAHNMLLTLIAETGLLGMIALVWLGVVGVKFIWFVFQKVDSSQWSMASMACMAAWIGFFAHGLVDSQFKFPAIMLMAAIFAGLGVAPYLSRVLSEKTWSRTVTVVALTILVVNAFVGIRGIDNISAYNQAVQAANRDDWQQALAYLQIADQLAPDVPFYQSQLGITLGFLSQNDSTYRPEAIAHYKKATDQLRMPAVDHANLACLLAEDGQPDAALQAIATAHELEPEYPLYRLNWGHQLETAKEFEAAWREYAKVIAHNPRYLQSSYWNQNEGRAAALSEIKAQAAEVLQNDADIGPLNLAWLYYYAEDYETALPIFEDILEQNLNDSVDARLGRAYALLSLGRLDEAKQEIDLVTDLDASNSTAYLLLSKIALSEGNLSSASENIEAALFLDDKNGDILYQAGVVAAALGNDTAAIEHYDAAFEQSLPHPPANPARYATEVARRRPLPAAYLPCVVQIYPTPVLVAATAAEGNLLERRGEYQQAVQVYRRLLDYEPKAALILTQYEALCQCRPDVCRD